jgi:hypothetical protein
MAIGMRQFYIGSVSGKTFYRVVNVVFNAWIDVILKATGWSPCELEGTAIRLDFLIFAEIESMNI